MDAALLVGIALLSLAAVLKLAQYFNSWYYEPALKPGQHPLPPGSLGWPILGNMPAFLRAFKSGEPDSFMAHYVARYKRVGLYKAFLFWQPTVLATTPEACKFVLCKDSFETGWPKSAIELSGPLSFAGLTGERHSRLRKLTEPAVNSPRALQEYMPVIISNVKACLERWSTQNKIVLLTEMRRLTFLTILHVLYGKDVKIDVDRTFYLYYVMNHGVRSFPLNLPGTAYNKALKARRAVLHIIQGIIDDRRTSGELHRTDTLGLLMKLMDEEAQPLINDEQIIDVLNMYMNAGHDSTAHVIMWLMIFLERHPDVLEKVKAEHDEIANSTPAGENISFSDIKRMRYSANVVDETLRLANISPMVFRKALVDMEFNGYTIPKGWHAEAWLRQVHMDPCVHADPEKFDPDRWEKDVNPYTLIPFGLGSRTCPGNELAKLQIFIILHYFVTGYKWNGLDNTSKVSYLPHPRPRDFYNVKVTKV